MSVAAAAPGDLDPTFATGGVAIDSAPDRVSAVAVQADGSVISAGSNVRHDRPSDLVIARHLATGELDPSFGSGGTTTLDLGGFEYIVDAVVEPTGSILLAAGTGEFTGCCDNQAKLTLIRLRPDGSLDPTMARDGTLVMDRPIVPPSGIAVTPEGKLLVRAGELVMRLLADGTLDPTFAEAGLRELSIGPAIGGEAISVASDGSIFTGGSGTQIANLTPDGDPIAAYGAGGVSGEPIVGRTGVSTLAVAPDGTIFRRAVKCGYPYAGCTNDVDLVTADGRSEAVLVRKSDDLALMADGVITGRAKLPALLLAPFVLDRFFLDARVDSSFGDEGRVVAWAGIEPGQLSDIAIGPDGKLVVAANLKHKRTAVARFTMQAGAADADADGTLDRDDRCPHGFGRSRSGCQTVAQSVTAKRVRRTTIRGSMSATNSTCTLTGRLKIFRARRGADQLVARRRFRTLYSAHYNYEVAAPGKYYVVAPAHPSDRARCAADRSDEVTVG